MRTRQTLLSILHSFDAVAVACREEMKACWAVDGCIDAATAVLGTRGIEFADGHLTVLGAEYVDLDSLGLTGGVPASLGKCAKLKTLLLWGNQLEGPIPDELGQCGALESLALSENQLEGAVPATELAALTALTYLDLEDNEGLTITASGAQALKNALPNAAFFLPTEVAG